MLPLVVAYGLLALAVVLVVADITSLYLERERLYALANGAALASAESFDVDAVVSPAGGEGPVHPVLDDASVKAAAEHYVSAAAVGDLPGLRLVTARTVDGRSASITLAAAWHPPVVSVFVPDGVVLTVTSRARSVFR